MFCFETNSAHDIKIEVPEKERYEMERFGSVLAISYPEKHSKNNGTLLLYDIVSGKVNEMSTEPCNQTVICSSNDKLFVISVVESETTASLLSFTVHEKVTGKLEVCANKKFAQPFEVKRPVFSKICLLFAHYVENEMHIFYCEDKYKNKVIKKLDITDELYLITVCVETFSVVRNRKVLIENPIFDKMFIELKKFKKCFYEEKTQKLAIYMRSCCSEAYPTTTDCKYSFSQMLFFDIKQQRFHLKELSVNEVLLEHFGLMLLGDPYKVLLRGDVLYVVCPQVRWLSAEFRQGLVRVCAFRYEDCVIADGKTLWKGEDQEIAFDEDVFIDLIIFNEDVLLVA